MVKKGIFGQYFKSKRKAKGLTLRQFCSKYGFDPGNISRLERGIFPPPQDRNKLEEFAACLEIEKGGTDWYTFFDLAAIESGKIPVELMEDEKVLDKLPLLFRTLRGEKVPEDKLNELIETIKGANSQQINYVQVRGQIEPRTKIVGSIG